MFDKFPYTNFHELNLDYFINKFNEIFTEWEQLNSTMLAWKAATDVSNALWKTSVENGLAAWKTATEADLNARETALRAELSAWKTATEADIGTWEADTLTALNAWKTTAEATFEAIRVQAAASATAAQTAQTAAETAQTAAETAQTAAETAAASVSASAAQIATNTGDISDVKAQLNILTLTSSDISANTYIKGGNGEYGTSETYVATDFINIENILANKIKFNSVLYSVYGFAFYDVNKTYISGLNGNGASTYGYENTTATQAIEWTIPANAAYFRASLRTQFYTTPSDFGIEFMFSAFPKTKDYKKASILTYSNEFEPSSSDFELGSINDTTGEDETTSDRLRTKKLYRAYKGMTINNTVGFAVYEYDEDGVYTGFSGVGYIKTYTFNKDTSYRLKFNSTDSTAIIDNLVFTPACPVVSPNILPVDALNENALKYVSNSLLMYNRSALYSYSTISSAHRGLSSLAPENTAPAFVLAKLHGFEYGETDIRVTSDGKFVCVHDQTLTRVTNGVLTGRVENYTLAELQAVDFGIFMGEEWKGTKVLTLEEYLDLCYSIQLKPWIEIKNNGYDAADVAQIVIDKGMEDVTVWMGISERIAIRSKIPYARVGWTTSAFTKEQIDQILTTPGYIVNNDPKTVYMAPEYTVITQDLADYARQNDIDVIAWPTDTPADIVDMLNMHVTGIVSNVYTAPGGCVAYYLAQ